MYRRCLRAKAVTLYLERGGNTKGIGHLFYSAKYGIGNFIMEKETKGAFLSIFLQFIIYKNLGNGIFH